MEESAAWTQPQARATKIQQKVVLAIKISPGNHYTNILQQKKINLYVVYKFGFYYYDLLISRQMIFIGNG